MIKVVINIYYIKVILYILIIKFKVKRWVFEFMTLLIVDFIVFKIYDLKTVLQIALLIKKYLLSSLGFKLSAKCFAYALLKTEPKLKTY